MTYTLDSLTEIVISKGDTNVYGKSHDEVKQEIRSALTTELRALLAPSSDELRTLIARLEVDLTATLALMKQLSSSHKSMWASERDVLVSAQAHANSAWTVMLEAKGLISKDNSMAKKRLEASTQDSRIAKAFLTGLRLSRKRAKNEKETE